MPLARSATFCLISGWIVACATAQDNSVPGEGTGATGATTSGSSGASGSLGRGGSNGVAGSNGAFGGSGGMPGSSGSLGNGGAGHAGAVGSAGATASAGMGGLASGGAGAGGASGGHGGASAGTGAGGAAAGAGGKVGAAGGGGTGGSAPVFDAGQCAASPTLSLSYKQSNTGQQMTGQYQFANLSDTPIPVASLKIRYFFTNEHSKGWDNHIYDAKIEGGTGGYRALTSGAALAEAPVSPALEGADTYAEVSFTGAATLEKGATATVSWDMQPIGYDAPFQVQTNDYSFNAADTDFAPWDHVAIYQGDTLVFGCLPKSIGGGSGGAGGTSAGGASSGGAGGVSGGGGAAMGGSAGGNANAGSGGAVTAGTGGEAGFGDAAGSP